MGRLWNLLLDINIFPTRILLKCILAWLQRTCLFRGLLKTGSINAQSSGKFPFQTSVLQGPSFPSATFKELQNSACGLKAVGYQQQKCMWSSCPSEGRVNFMHGSHQMLPLLSWYSAFLLCSMLSPPDQGAASLQAIELLIAYSCFGETQHFFLCIQYCFWS